MPARRDRRTNAAPYRNSLRSTFFRVVASTSELLCDGHKPGTLLGAIPGLSSATLAQHATSLGGNAVKCGLRLILKSYELDVVATSMEEARAWVRRQPPAIGWKA